VTKATKPAAAERAHASFREGIRAAGAGRYDDALAAYADALRLCPDFVEAHNNAGILLGALGRLDEAILHLERAAALGPQNAATHANVAVARYLNGDLTGAELAYQRSLELDPGNAEAQGHLGEIYIELGKVEDGRTAIAGALERAPAAGWLYRRWAESGIVQPGDEQLRIMERLRERAHELPSDDAMQLHFALGKAYDDVGRFDDAFAAFSIANAMRRATVDYDEGTTIAFMDAMRASFDRATVAVAAASIGGIPARQAVTFVVGMPRSGTTLVEQILAAHPGVRAIGESGAFERAIVDTLGPSWSPDMMPDASAFEELAAAYARNAAPDSAADQRRIVDKTLQNFMFAGAIHRALPEARFVHVMREPLDACMSAYAQYFRDGQTFTYDLGELGRYYAAYRRLTDHWRDVLPESVWLDVQYEQLVGDLEPQARRIVAFCGLTWDAACLSFYTARNAVRTASAAQVRRPLYATSVGRAQRYDDKLSTLRAALDPTEPQG
jgi:tetratricopeptide (TPR) repeat protein